MMILFSASHRELPNEKYTIADRNPSNSSLLHVLKAFRKTRTGSRYSSSGGEPAIVLEKRAFERILNLPFFSSFPIRRQARSSERNAWYRWKTSAGSFVIRHFFFTEACIIMLSVSFTSITSLNWKNVSSKPTAKCFRVPDQNRALKSFFFFITLFFRLKRYGTQRNFLSGAVNVFAC